MSNVVPFKDHMRLPQVAGINYDLVEARNALRAGQADASVRRELLRAAKIQFKHRVIMDYQTFFFILIQSDDLVKEIKEIDDLMVIETTSDKK